MVGEVRVEGVVLREDDLNIARSLWRRVNRANGLRILPMPAGALLGAGALGMLQPSLLELASVAGPVVLGTLLFIWLTNSLYLREYKAAYAESPIGAAPCTFIFDAEGMKQSAADFEVAFRWRAFVDVVEDSTAFRFWMTPYSAVVLPARYLGDSQRVRLRELIVEAREAGHIKGAPE